MHQLKLFFGMCIALCLVASTGLAAGKVMSVQVKNGVMRSTPSYLGKPVKTVFYGSRVIVMKTRGKWIHVASGPTEGWMHESALTSKKIIMKAGASDARLAASSSEVALAGKGFNKQVESQYQVNHPKFKQYFREVDALERERVSQQKIQRFIQEGQLTPGGGAE